MELTFITSDSIFDYFLNATEPNFSLKPLTPLAPKYRFLLALLFTLHRDLHTNCKSSNDQD